MEIEALLFAYIYERKIFTLDFECQILTMVLLKLKVNLQSNLVIGTLHLNPYFLFLVSEFIINNIIHIIILIVQHLKCGFLQQFYPY